MPWWVWVLVGFFLLALELLSSGIHLGFFGAGAMIVALLVAMGVGGPLWVQLLSFSVISIVLLALFRQPILRKLRESGAGREVDAVVGQIAHAQGDIAAGSFGRAELRGTSWSAKNVGGAPLAAGQRCLVEKVDGLTLWVRAES